MQGKVAQRHCGRVINQHSGGWEVVSDAVSCSTVQLAITARISRWRL